MQVPLLDLSAQFARIRPDVLRAIEAVCDSQRFILGPEVEALRAEIAGSWAPPMRSACRRAPMRCSPR